VKFKSLEECVCSTMVVASDMCSGVFILVLGHASGGKLMIKKVRLYAYTFWLFQHVWYDFQDILRPLDFGVGFHVFGTFREQSTKRLKLH
jgi:hypothetical protein